MENEFDSAKATPINKGLGAMCDVCYDIKYDYGNKEQNRLLLSTKSIKEEGIIVSTKEIEFGRLYVDNGNMPTNGKTQKNFKSN